MNDYHRFVLQQPEYQTYSLWIIVLAFIVLLFQHSWLPGFFHDGYLHGSIGQSAIDHGRWLISRAHQDYYQIYLQHPPLTFILQGFFYALFGYSWLSARLFSCLFVVLIAWLIFFMFRQTKEKPQWLWFSLFIFIANPAVLKLARYPNLDFPLTFFIMLGLYFYWKAFQVGPRTKVWNINWLYISFCFGATLLTKGPAGLILPIVICLHIILMKKWHFFLDPFPYAGIFIGFFIFGAWIFYGDFVAGISIWKHYILEQVVFTIFKGRGLSSNNYFGHLIFLSEKALPWLLLSLFGSWKIWKNRLENPLATLFLALFLGVLFPLSLMTLKYSNFLAPLYPGMAVTAAFGLGCFSESLKAHLAQGLKRLLFLTMAIFLIFPIGTKIKRDPVLFEVMALGEYLYKKPEAWVNVDNAYADANFLGFMAFRNKERFASIISEGVLKEGKLEWAYLMKTSTLENLEQAHPTEFSTRFKRFFYFPENDLWIVVGQNLLGPYLQK
jgi:4-amino-4-deoxy-L-arabinose transferase-like glycosyltransferase